MGFTARIMRNKQNDDSGASLRKPRYSWSKVLRFISAQSNYLRINLFEVGCWRRKYMKAKRLNKQTDKPRLLN